MILIGDFQPEWVLGRRYHDRLPLPGDFRVQFNSATGGLFHQLQADTFQPGPAA